jgi:hypothetical protein
MSGDSRSHLDRSTQRRFRVIVLTCAAIAALILTPLVLNDQLRLDTAHRLNLAPGKDVERVATADDDLRLIVVPIQAVNEARRSEIRFRAAFLAREGPDGVELEFIDSGERIALGLEAYDFYSASDDGNFVLFQDTRNPDAIQGELIDLSTGDVTAMPAESPYPTDIPGDWERGAWETPMGRCEGFSPHAKFIACFKNPALSTFLAGDWELQVRVYGSAQDAIAIYRGIGILPLVGWSNDDSRVYFQNEEGIWMSPVSLDMFN